MLHVCGGATQFTIQGAHYYPYIQAQRTGAGLPWTACNRNPHDRSAAPATKTACAHEGRQLFKNRGEGRGT